MKIWWRHQNYDAIINHLDKKFFVIHWSKILQSFKWNWFLVPEIQGGVKLKIDPPLPGQFKTQKAWSG